MHGGNAESDEEDKIDKDPRMTGHAIASSSRARTAFRWPDEELPDWASASGRDPITGNLRPRRCGLYLPGHEVHWIQAKKSAEERTPPERAKLVAVEGDDLVVVRMVGLREYRCYHSHEVPRLVEAAGGFERAVEVQQRWGILWTGGGRFCVCRYGREWSPCPETPLTLPAGPVGAEELVRLVRERGGFSLPMSQLDLGSGG